MSFTQTLTITKTKQLMLCVYIFHRNGAGRVRIILLCASQNTG